MSLRHFARLAVLAAGLVLVPLATAFAQSGVTRIIIGVPAGGAIDPYARMIADHMAKTLGHPFIVENKVGASGNVAAQYIADQPADGSMIWLGTQAFVEILPNVFKNSRWSIDSFHPIIRGVEAPLVFIVHPGVPATTFTEFLAWAKQNKGKLSYSSYQAGTPAHFLGFQMNEKFGLDLTHVPFGGSGLQANALLGGHAQFGFAQVNSTFTLVQSGKLRALGTTGDKRDRSLPDVPTFAELGYPEFTAKVWFGLLVKEGTPPDTLKRLTDAAIAAHADPEIRKKLEAQGFDVVAETGPQLKTGIREQTARWGRLVQASGWSVEDRGSTR